MNFEVINTIDAIVYFPASESYKEHIADLLQGNSKLSKSIPQFDIPEDIKGE